MEEFLFLLTKQKKIIYVELVIELGGWKRRKIYTEDFKETLK